MRSLIDHGLVERLRLEELCEEIEPQLLRFPAVDPGASCLPVENGVRRSTD